MSKITDEAGYQMIGHVNVGGLALSRTELAQSLPDIERFERCLSDAEMVNDHMSNHGKPPAAFFGWSDHYIGEVQATMREVGALQTSAATRLQAELAAR